ncbi:MAG: phospho-N-acetylmuramoyl-pentapeptide-transferase, partial [Lachnospiraceae bacterium]|nr:phospho-N-acetylmuramoyl-pentapeptide-transferase [Lachnospiraceae bacterium]
PVLIAFLIGIILAPFVISTLKKNRANQTEREELASHQKKTGTPTMGGIIIIGAFLITGLIYVRGFPEILPVMILAVGFGVIGFLDDFLKVVLRRSDGLLAWQKMLLQIVVTTLFLCYMLFVSHEEFWMYVPFTGGKVVDIGILALPLVYFVVIGTVNGTNFTDGLDGLASSVTVIVSAFFVAAAGALSSGVVPAAAAMCGALLAFLCYNCYPAKIFMGDTGSLALGGFVAGMAYVLHLPLFIPVIGFIYLVEVISVILQVGYFKMTHGKRIFRMAPIHHHYELGGWSETKVVTIFSIVTALLCLAAFVTM